MKVILTSKIKNLGDIGDIVDVSSGYAKNFLLPNKKVLSYNESNYEFFKLKKSEFEIQNHKSAEEAKVISEKLIGKDVIIVGNASDDGRLYGSVTTNLISGKLNEILGKKLVTRSNIILKKPIKDIGVYEVKVSLYSNVQVDIRVIVTRSESEIDSLLSPKKKEGKKEELAG